MNILVVDDNPMVLESCCRILSDEKTRVQTAADARTARGILADAPPFDLIITDIMMPGENWLSFSGTDQKASSGNPGADDDRIPGAGN